MKFNFLEFFISNGKKQSNLYSNSQIHIQMIKFKFKRINQDATPHYRSPAPVINDSAGDTIQPNSITNATAHIRDNPGSCPALHVSSCWCYRLA
jgi:hypothetical protein